jgi:hypothetical protein
MVCFAVFSGCGETGGNGNEGIEIPELGTFEGLSAETERRIKLDYVQTYLDPASATVDAVQMYYYFGNYNGYEVAAFFTGKRRDDDLYCWVNYGYNVNTMMDDRAIFRFPREAAMLAWKPEPNSESGHFYTMQDAYDAGLLTRDDVELMRNKYYGLGPFEDLDWETKTRIAAFLWDAGVADAASMGDEYSWYYGWYYGQPFFEDLDEERKNDVVSRIWNGYNFFYLGTYHDYVVIGWYDSSWDTSGTINVHDYIFYFPGIPFLEAWYKGEGLSWYDFGSYWGDYDTDGNANGWINVVDSDSRYPTIDYNTFLTKEDAKVMWERYLVRGKQGGSEQ